MSVAPSTEPVAEDDWAKDLNYQQEQFVLEFEAQGFKHAGKAAGIAGYAAAHTQGPRLLKNVWVAAAIHKRRESYYQSKHLSRHRILWELANVAGFDLGEVMRVDSGGNPHLDLSMATEEHTRVLKEIETTRETLYEGKGKDAKSIGTLTKVKVKMHDKMAALRLLMQHLGMINEGGNIQVNIGFGDRIAARRAKIIDQEPD